MKTSPKFRGKRLDNGQDVIGDAVTDCIFSRERDGSTWIFVSSKYNGDGWVQVDPSTVEQIGGDVVEENNRLREALSNLLDCIQETRGSDATDAVWKARELIKEK